MSGEKKILKFYNVALNDIDDKGNVNPDAKLLPLYSKQFNIRPKDVKETLSSDDWYDDSTNVHKDIHFTTFLPDGTVFKDLPVKHRGYSALSYFSKPDRSDSLMSDRTHSQGKHYATIYSPKEKFALYKDALHKVDFDAVPPVERNSYAGKVLKDADKRSLKNFIEFILKKGVPAENERGNAIIPVVASTDDSDIIKLNDLWKGYDPGRNSLNEAQTRHIYNKYVPKNWVKYYSLQDLHDSIDTWRDSIKNGKAKPDAFGHTGLEHFNSILDLINEVNKDNIRDIHDLFMNYPILNENHDLAADWLHAILDDIRLKHPETSNERARFAIYAPYTIDKLLREDFPYESKHGKTPTLSDKHYKQIIGDLYDDIQKDKTRSNITNTLMEAKYV